MVGTDGVSAERRSARLMLGASALTTLGAIPPFLVGAQAVLLMHDLDFGAARLGVAVSTFFAVAALVTILATEGSAPRGPGARMVVTETGLAGSIGGGRLEHQAMAQARSILALEPGSTMRRFVPIEAKALSTRAFAPSPIATIAMTAATPMTMPSVVKNERVLFRKSARRAIRNV